MGNGKSIGMNNATARGPGTAWQCKEPIERHLAGHYSINSNQSNQRLDEPQETERFQSASNPLPIHFQSIFNPFSIHFQWNAIESDNNGNWRNKNMNQSAIERRHGNQRPIKTWESLNKRSIISVSIQLESIHSFIRPDEIKAQRKWQPFSTIRINWIDGKIHHHHQLDQSVFQKKNMARKWCPHWKSTWEKRIVIRWCARKSFVKNGRDGIRLPWQRGEKSRTVGGGWEEERGSAAAAAASAICGAGRPLRVIYISISNEITPWRWCISASWLLPVFLPAFSSGFSLSMPSNRSVDGSIGHFLMNPSADCHPSVEMAAWKCRPIAALMSYLSG